MNFIASSTFPGNSMTRNLFRFWWKHADIVQTHGKMLKVPVAKKGAFVTTLHSNARFKSQENQSYFPPWPFVRIMCG